MRTFLLVALVPSALLAVDPAWLVHGPDGVIARTIVTGDCPSITIDGMARAMTVRSAPVQDYNVTTCEAAIPHGAKSASIGTTTLPVHKLGRAKRIALLGDTGCRMKGGSVQECSDLDDWPFKTIAESIAKADPDLILHVGDYYYRECDRPTDCTNVTYYDWNRWNADFFEPAAALLPNAPWIMVRGNHEDCGRAAEGWFRFLEPRPYVWMGNATCTSELNFTPPYRVSVAGQDFIVADTSGAKDYGLEPNQSYNFQQQLRTLCGTRSDAWLLQHHPYWYFSEWKGKTDPGTEMLWSTWVREAPVELIVAGHVHLLEILSFEDGRPPQIAVGNGGTELDDPPTITTGTTIGGRTIASSFIDKDFGWMMAERHPRGGWWVFTINDKNGKAKAKCALKGGALTCEP